MWRKKILPFFLFNRKERRGIYLLLFIITAMWMIPWFFSSPVSPITPDELTIIEQARDTLLARQKNEGGYPGKSPKNGGLDSRTGRFSGKAGSLFSPKSLFLFDPNTATESNWKELGLQEKTIATLRNYLSKGGRIRKPEDLKKIYGFPEEAYEKLQPFIRIKEAEDDSKKNSKWKFEDNKRYIKKANDIQRISINQADSSQWEALPGIGPKLAARIMLFRTKLGGFYSIEQVAETYGLPDSTFRKIKPYLHADDVATIVGLDINHASREELQAHPYLTYQLARVIIAYRDQHGPFKQADEIKKLALMTPELFARLEPYIAVY
jgi:DNA uptake protein ComE-like DNA-binding protein